MKYLLLLAVLLVPVAASAQGMFPYRPMCPYGQIAVATPQGWVCIRR